MCRPPERALRAQQGPRRYFPDSAPHQYRFPPASLRFWNGPPAAAGWPPVRPGPSTRR